MFLQLFVLCTTLQIWCYRGCVDTKCKSFNTVSWFNSETAIFGWLFVKRFTLCYRTNVLSVCPVCNVGVLWPNGLTDPDETWHADLGPGHILLDGHIVLDRDPAPPPQRGIAPIFGRYLLRSAWIKMALSIEVSLGPGNFVLDGDLAPFPKREWSPLFQFLAHCYCGQTDRCIKMPLGMEVGLSPDDIVLDGDPAPPPQKGTEPPPQFSAHVYCGQTAGWIKMALGMEVGLIQATFC